MLYSINALAILPVGQCAYSAQFLQIIRHILRSMRGEPLRRHGLEVVLGADDIPSDRRWLHLFRSQASDITIPKTVT